MNQNQKVSRKESGQSLVEMALSFTILMLLVAGVIDLGRAFFTYISLSDAAQEGGAYAAMEPTDSAGIRSRVKETTNSPVDLSIISDGSIAITPSGSYCAGFSGSVSNSIQVTVTYTLQFLFPMSNLLLPGGQITLNATSVNTIIRPIC